MDKWTQVWEDRFGKETFAYGTEPNDFFKAQIDILTTGNILFAAEGEGRNAVYAARKGWNVQAFDISQEGKKKALKLAKTHRVNLDYQIGFLPELNFTPNQLDAIALIYAHFPADIKSDYHQQLEKLLKSGGVIIFEAFSKNHLEYVTANPNIGGPKDLAMLFSIEEIQHDFPNFEIILLEEKVIELHEGEYHNGTGSVIRFVGRKK
jgi:2-polyprenyl-3-methyl-5-hydroxy-6-metoxy-1,4-benzoquinol methylase